MRRDKLWASIAAFIILAAFATLAWCADVQPWGSVTVGTGDGTVTRTFTTWVSRLSIVADTQDFTLALNPPAETITIRAGEVVNLTGLNIRGFTLTNGSSGTGYVLWQR